jgi:hypothetical protein
MGATSLRFRIYAWSLFVLGAAATIATWRAGWRLPINAMSVTLLAAVLVSELLAVDLPNGASISLSYPLTVSAIVLLGPIGAVAAVVVSSLPYLMPGPSRFFTRTVFNLGQIALSALLPAWLYIWLGGRLLAGQPMTPADFPALLLPLAAAASMGIVANFLLGGIGHSMINDVSLESIWREAFSWMLASQVAFGLLGIAIAQVMSITGAMGLALFVVPLVVARQLHQRYLNLREAYADTIRSLVGAIEAKDPYTKGHSVRVAHYVSLIARRMGRRPDEAERLERAALLHDLGKVGVSSAVLCKEGRLNETEFSQIRKHPDIAAHILESVPHLADIVPVVQYHHERYDGGGYGAGLVGEDIPLDARILAVADSYDAMTSDRAYRRALSDAEAVEELRRNAGGQFDESIVEALIAALPADEGYRTEQSG